MPLSQKSLRQETTGRMTKKPKNKQQSSFLAFLSNLVRNSIFGKKEEKIGILIFKEIFCLEKKKGICSSWRLVCETSVLVLEYPENLLKCFLKSLKS